MVWWMLYKCNYYGTRCAIDGLSFRITAGWSILHIINFCADRQAATVEYQTKTIDKPTQYKRNRSGPAGRGCIVAFGHKTRILSVLLNGPLLAHAPAANGHACSLLIFCHVIKWHAGTGEMENNDMHGDISWFFVQENYIDYLTVMTKT